ncbi:MAG: helix-turn-helix transcriptional regulator [Cellvibrionales bacterium]|nr:helix-turn-helix transcriptional regulator [Cellvibrionales bacterium]
MKKITPVNVKESEKLKALFVKKQKIEKFNQKEAATMIGMTQPGLSHYLNAVNPIGLHAAIKLSAFLECKISDFSPRLAAIAGEKGAPEQNIKNALMPKMTPLFNIEDSIDQLEEKKINKVLSPAGFKGIAVIVPDTAMQTNQGVSIPKGACARIDTKDTNLQDGKYYLIKPTCEKEPMIRLIVKLGSKWVWQTTNDKHKIISDEISIDDKIIGRVLGKR